MDLEIREVDKFLKKKGIAISGNNVWLKSCVECFRTQKNNYNIKELIEFVNDQWLLADLREVRSGTLPKDCNSLEKFTLTGVHAVQLNYIIDVSTSSYMQLQQLRRPDFSNNFVIEDERDIEVEREIKKKGGARRSLKIEITDGLLTLIGFEDKPISSLKNPVPGEKALLKGPIECRNGILMLRDINIEILGGEVDTLLIPNAVSNVHSRILGQPEDPNPYRQHNETILEHDDEILSSCLDKDDDEVLLSLAESIASSVVAPKSTLSNSESVYQTQNIIDDSFEFEDDGFDLLAAQTAFQAELEATHSDRGSLLRDNCRMDTGNAKPQETSTGLPLSLPGKASSVRSVNSFDNEYVDINDPKRLKKELEQSYGSEMSYYKIKSNHPKSESDNNKQENVQSYNSPNTVTKKKSEEISCKSSLSLKIEESPMDHSNISPNTSHEMTLTLVAQQTNANISEDTSFSCLSQEFEEQELSDQFSENSDTFYQPYPPRKFPSLRAVRGKVISISEKLTLKNNQWCLTAVVYANGLEIDMAFAPEVLDKIFGVTASALIARRKDLKTNPAAKEQMNQLLRNSQLRIKNLNCEMVVSFPSVIAKPIIVDVMQ